MNTALIFDPALIRKYDKAGPRYTSYPTAVQFHAGFDEAEYREQASASNIGGGPLSLYVHIPFCDTVLNLRLFQPAKPYRTNGPQ